MIWSKIFGGDEKARLEKENAELRGKMELAGKVADRAWLLELENKALTNSRRRDAVVESAITMDLRKENAMLRRENAALADKMKECKVAVRLADNDTQMYLHDFLETRKLLATARAKIGAKTKAVNTLARKAESNKSHLGRFYWPATAYCEAALPCI